MTTIQIEAPTLRDLARAAAADWGPALHSTARLIAAVVVAVYAAGLVAGAHWRRLLAWADRHHHEGLARLGIPGAELDPRRQPSIDVPLPVVIDLEALQRAERTTPSGLPSPTTCEACHRLRRQGLRPAAIARRLKISRRAVDEVLAA